MRVAEAATSASAPQRIVSLSPGITEILYALNLGGRVVGDTEYCDYPPAAKSKPHIGDMVVNYEALLALRPDLIVADAVANRSAIPRLRELHLPVLVVTSNSISEVESSISAIAQRTGVPGSAKAVIAQMEHNLRSVSQIVSGEGGSKPVRTLVTVGLTPLYVAGTQSFMGDMVQRGHGIDLAGNTAYVPWSNEQVIASQPEAVFCSKDDKKALLSDPAWSQTPAVRKGNVFVYTSSAFMRPGPRLAQAAVAVATDLSRVRR